MATSKKTLTSLEKGDLLTILQVRFEKNMQRHKGLAWKDVEAKLSKNADALWSLHEMERTGGEPDVIGVDKKSGAFLYVDCSAESPSGRRSLCYDREALDKRKENKPAGNALETAAQMGIEVLDEELYRKLQSVGKFDAKTSSWLITPAPIRKLGGAIFGDFRYDTIFIYHNGAESYYAARGFRGLLYV